MSDRGFFRMSALKYENVFFKEEGALDMGMEMNLDWHYSNVIIFTAG